MITILQRKKSALFQNLHTTDNCKEKQSGATRKEEQKMKIFTTANNFVTLITKNATPYTIEGRAGITYRVVVMSGDDV